MTEIKNSSNPFADENYKPLTEQQQEKLKKFAEDRAKEQSNNGLRSPLTMSNNKVAVGRIVHYWPRAEEFLDGNDSSPLPAVIVRTWSDECVNLKVLTDGPVDAWKTSILPKSETNIVGVWSWPQRS